VPTAPVVMPCLAVLLRRDGKPNKQQRAEG
jgi:hypothetical protein